MDRLQRRFVFHRGAARHWLTAAWLAFAATAVQAAEPRAAPAEVPTASGLLRAAIDAESRFELSQAAALYEEAARRGEASADRRLAVDARQGLRRVESLRAGFAWTREDLERRLAQAFRGYRPEELGQWERQGWLYARQVDGQPRYHVSNVTNLAFFDTGVRRRNPHLADGDRFFARVFLEAAAELDAVRRAAVLPERHVLPEEFRYVLKAVIRQEDLPAGPTLRAWLPVPLLSPATQEIRLVRVEPAGALRSPPDVEGTIGIAYLEVPRPASGDLTLLVEVAFQSRHSDIAVDADRLPPYDRQSELYRRFTRSEPQILLNEPTVELARSIVGEQQNAWRKARRLYDWVCDHCTYNFVWHQRDSTFTWGSASEEVRQRRIGDCVIQSMFYAALCRSVGIPARVVNGPVFPPCFKNDHVWAEVYFPGVGWFPVDVTYSEVIALAPDLSDAQRRRLRDFFFGRLDRWRFCTQRDELSQPLVPAKESPRKRVTMFTYPEFECGGRDVEKATVTWECGPRQSAAK